MMGINKLDKSYFHDPRSISPSGQLIPLDGMTLHGKVCLDDIQTGYYNSYADIRAGQITYYIDKDVQRPFPSQLFNLNNSFIHYDDDYVDPNGVHKPHRRFISGDNNDDNDSSSSSCLSFIRDTQTFRNDMLSSHMWRRHQEEFTS